MDLSVFNGHIYFLLMHLGKAFLIFEIIWISVEVFEANPSLPWPGSVLSAEHPCHGGQLDLYRKKSHVFQQGFISSKSKLPLLISTDAYTPTPFPQEKKPNHQTQNLCKYISGLSQLTQEAKDWYPKPLRCSRNASHHPKHTLAWMKSFSDLKV